MLTPTLYTTTLCIIVGVRRVASRGRRRAERWVPERLRLALVASTPTHARELAEVWLQATTGQQLQELLPHVVGSGEVVCSAELDEFLGKAVHITEHLSGAAVIPLDSRD